MAQLAIADHLRNGPRSLKTLSSDSGVAENRLSRIMRGLVQGGFCNEPSPGTYELTQLGEPLRSDINDSMRPLALFMGSRWRLRAWSSLAQSARHGDSGMEAEFGLNLFDFLDANPDEARIFHEAMSATSDAMTAALLESIDLGGTECVVDIGGGSGHLLSGLLLRYPTARGTVVDRPAVAKSMHDHFTTLGIGDRATFVDGDFFRDVPRGDVFILQRVIHDWDDHASHKLLAVVRAALNPGGRVMVIETVMQAPPSLDQVALDLEMMVLTNGGRERTREEFADLFAGAGLRLQRVVDTRVGISVLEARDVNAGPVSPR